MPLVPGIVRAATGRKGRKVIMVARFKCSRADDLRGFYVHHIMGIDEFIANDIPALSSALSG